MSDNKDQSIPSLYGEYVKAFPPSEGFKACSEGVVYRNVGSRFRITEETVVDSGYAYMHSEHMDSLGLSDFKLENNFGKDMVEFLSPMLSINNLRSLVTAFENELARCLAERSGAQVGTSDEPPCGGLHSKKNRE